MALSRSQRSESKESVPESLRRSESKESVPESLNSNDTTASLPRNAARIKLPKLEIKKFNGKLQEWSEFWDSFNSAIHSEQGLAKVDKFKYLR